MRRSSDDIPWWPEWTELSACRDKDPQLFFDYGKDKRKVELAKRVCRECPVRPQCLKANIGMPWAIVGGYTWLERWRMLNRPGYPRDSGIYRFFEEVDILSMMKAEAGKLRWTKPRGESITGHTG